MMGSDIASTLEANQGKVPQKVQKLLQMEKEVLCQLTVIPGLDALHILDASARFDAGWSGRNTF